MRKMSIAREIKIQRLQNKNRMTGQTFNPEGHTSESLKQREIDLVQHYKSLSEDERLKAYNNFKSVDQWKRDNNIHCSNSFEHNAFMRNFSYEFLKIE